MIDQLISFVNQVFGIFADTLFFICSFAFLGWLIYAFYKIAKDKQLVPILKEFAIGFVKIIVASFALLAILWIINVLGLTNDLKNVFNGIESLFNIIIVIILIAIVGSLIYVIVSKIFWKKFK